MKRPGIGWLQASNSGLSAQFGKAAAVAGHTQRCTKNEFFSKDFTTMEDNAAEIIEFVDKQFGGCVLLIAAECKLQKLQRKLPFEHFSW